MAVAVFMPKAGISVESCIVGSWRRRVGTGSAGEILLIMKRQAVLNAIHAEGSCGYFFSKRRGGSRFNRRLRGGTAGERFRLSIQKNAGDGKGRNAEEKGAFFSGPRARGAGMRKGSGKGVVESRPGRAIWRRDEFIRRGGVHGPTEGLSCENRGRWSGRARAPAM